MTVGIIRVISSEDPEFLGRHGLVLERFFGLQTVSRAIPDQPTGIHSSDTELRAIPKVIAAAHQLVEQEKVSSVLISCAADPGLGELRGQLPVPVVGAGAAAAALAMATADRIGVLGITAEVPAAVADALGDRLVADIVPAGVSDTTDLLTAQGRAAALQAASELKAAGAQCIVFACTGLTTIGLRPEVVAEVGVPVVDAVLAAGSVLRHLEIFGRS